MTKGQGKGRGMLQMDTWMPARRPGQPRNTNIKPIIVKELVQNEQKPETNGTLENGSSVKTAHPTPPTPKGPKILIAKYNYEANKANPGGFEEMSITAGERLTFVASHPVNPYWWEALKETGEIAFIPATYVMILEEKVTSLPWLEERKAEKEKVEQEKIASRSTGFGAPEKTVFKPYSSAYTNPEKDSSNNKPEYFCELCNKQLNGPKPYEAHIVSKAHKDEVEAASAYVS
ncbi:uncharacterized protein LOC116292061 [Actinia tenebrosa]|uniref:Uncharacterized protein LOC116292061 n=1 Tax=Actinia tenebrosa TaxID=6105 RepID=A0A6P8HH37_ACTTE|nr:uncharacterized protein LOC116292061 [Actinia tenebrosa]